VVSILLIVAAIGSGVTAQPQSKPARWERLTAEEVSRQFLTTHSTPRDDAEQRIIAVMDNMFANQSKGMGNILPEDGRLMRMLTESLEAKHVVELGTANGYSSLWFCLALRSTGGKLTTHELAPDRIAMARANFKQAGVEGLLTLVEGDAHQMIKRLVGPIDVVLLDAEKEGFVDYLNKLLPIVRPGGLIIAHDSSGEAHKMHDYFEAIAAHPDLDSVMVDASRWGMCITRKMR